MAKPTRVLYLGFVVGLAAAVITIWTTLLARPAAAQEGDNAGPIVVIDAVLFDGYSLDDADEAVRLINIGSRPEPLQGWSFSDGGSTKSEIASDLVLMPGQGVWVARNRIAFRDSFGEEADYQPERWPGFANTGDEVVLSDRSGRQVDVLVYLDGDTSRSGWLGAAVVPYQVPGVFPGEGQILYRRREPTTGQPIADTDSAADWAQMTADVIHGRKVQYPGWRLDDYFFPLEITATATLTIAVAPDNAYEVVVEAIEQAKASIKLASLTLEHNGIGLALSAAAERGVQVELLLEGAPPGGLADQERYICQVIESAGGSCWFMISDEVRRIHNRYRYMHAKYMVIDDRVSVISSENFSPNSMPDDDKNDGTWGRRGVVILTDEPAIAAHLAQIFADDLDAKHGDILRWSASNAQYGSPPPGFIPRTEAGGITYTVRFPNAAIITGTHAFVLQQAPENMLSNQSGLLKLIDSAGEGDRLLIEQLTERPFWGKTTSNTVDDPNPRLEAVIAAARRGARVHFLLDEFYDVAGSRVGNAATCAYVAAISFKEDLAIECSLGNPSGMGIHNKMILAWVNGKGYVHIGSLNGTELSSKGNREIAIQIQSDEAFHYLARMFAGDLQPRIFLPLALYKFDGGADHLLISEIVYDTPGPDEAEFIELVNPTAHPIDLAGYALGDAVYPTDFEDRRMFPEGTILQPGKPLVIALSGTAFRMEFGLNPDFEIVDTDPVVPNMIDDPAWGDAKALLRLGNTGDEVVVWQGELTIDVVTYGDGAHPAVVGCPLLISPNRSLERRPYWRDTNDCPVDFKPQPFPSPGRLP